MHRTLLSVVCLALPASSAAGQVFEAVLTPGEVVPVLGAPAPVSDATAYGTFVLDQTDPANPTLTYSITFNNFDVASEMQGMHFHAGDPGQNGPHALNVYGMPREDDADMVVSGNTISGIWDNSDRNYGPDGTLDNGDSVALSDALFSLLNDQIYVNVHSFAYPAPNTGELRGQIVQVVPEPAGLGLLGLAGLLLRRRR